MSPDEIFAAHMWPWPDPLLKRDGMGRIIFVNAAFLQMYGGRVEDWRGNSVGGWPAPQNTGHPNRFETRVAGADGEQIYDWIEYILADGCGLAIARNVTNLLTPETPPPGNIMVTDTPMDTGQAQAETHHEPATQAPLAAQMAAQTDNQALDTHDPMPQGDWDTDIDYRTPTHAPTPETAEHAAPADTAPMEAPASENMTLGVHAEDTSVSSHDPKDSGQDSQSYNPQETAQHSTLDAGEPGAHADIQSETPPAAAQAAATEPQTDPAPQPPVRDHERRALPIENGDSVLGNNWRDAVIAKAVGSAMPRPDVQGDEEAAPANPENQPQAAPAAPSSDKKSKSELRILLAEDNAINALLTRTLLEAEGCSVDVVEDGALAVDAVQNAQYDLIFMDMRMPNMDGLESTRKIRALTNVPSNMPIIALTANAFDDDRNACFDSGMNDFMTKPVSAEELSQMVDTWALNTPDQRMAS
ncbi:response regulator [Fretibacter rubidus]|uniref:response regulator n=1 Tax=Fretibacter rubidus TaxID=570162 RepID=UPI00352B8C20